MKLTGHVRRIAYQATGLGLTGGAIDCRQFASCRMVYDPRPIGDKRWIGHHEQRVGALFVYCGERAVNFVGISRSDLAKLQPQYTRWHARQPAASELWKTALSGFQSTATRASLGTISFSSCRDFPTTSPVMEDVPVMLASGRARLVSSPEPMGSETASMTTGIFVVEALAAIDAWVTTATITSTLRRTNSVASAGSRSNFPSANRYSMTMFLPST